MYVILEKWIN